MCGVRGCLVGFLMLLKMHTQVGVRLEVWLEIVAVQSKRSSLCLMTDLDELLSSC